jgi:hypothetical protein
VSQRRSSFVVISVTVHAIVLVALLATSIFAPGMLPVPKTLNAWAPERIVQAVDITAIPIVMTVTVTFRLQ